MDGERSENSAYTGSDPSVKLPYDKLAAHVTSWLLNPLPEVGNRNSALHMAPTSIDSASQPGCKSQTYTTWNCWNRSYYAGHCVKLNTVTSTPQIINTGECPMFAVPYSEIPQSFLDDQPRAVVKLLENKKRWYSCAFDPKGRIYSAQELESASKLLASRKSKANLAGTAPTLSSFESLGISSEDDPSYCPPTSGKKKKKTKRMTRKSAGLHAVEVSVERMSGDESETAPQEAVAAPKPQSTDSSYLYSDIMPVRAVDVTNWPTAHNFHADIPKSSLYKLMEERLQDHTNVGALGAIAKSPAFRDGSSIMALVKAMENRPASLHEHAAMLRAGLVVASLDKFTYNRDPIPTQLIRRFVPDSSIATSPVIGTSDQSHSTTIKISAITLDMFVAWALNKGIRDMPLGWSYLDLDESITCVPMNSTAMSNSWAMAYLTSFASSELWNGRINHVVNGHWENENWDNDRGGSVTLMPAANSVWVPGCKRILIVLVDVSAAEGPTTIRPSPLNMNISVVRGGNNRVLETDITNWWYQTYFTTGNIPNISADFTWAWNHICEHLALRGTCGYAASLLAELYTVQKFGIGIDREFTGAFKNEEAHGAWAWKGGYADTKTGGVVKCDKWPEKMDGTDNSLARQLLTGFNFSSVSPLHVLPTGLVKTKYNVNWKDSTDGVHRYPNQIFVYWSTSSPEYSAPGYRCGTMTSIYRVGTYIGLLDTVDANLLAGSASGLVSFAHMLGGALGMSMSIHLSCNDVGFKVWAGLDIRNGQMRPTETIQRMKETMTSGMLVHNDIKSLELSSGGEWDWDKVTLYYSYKDIFVDNSFGSYSPWPIHAIHQWENKLKITDGEIDRRLKSIPVEASISTDFDTVFQGIRLYERAGIYKALAPSSIDIRRYAPFILYRQALYSMTIMPTWVENWQYLSQTYLQRPSDRQYWETLSLTLPVQDYMFQGEKINDLIIINTKYMCPGESDYSIRTSDILFPDPPTLESFLSAAKAYLLDPAIAGFSHYAKTGNPFTAAAAAGEKIYDNYQSRKAASEQAEREQQAREKQEEVQAAEVKEIPPHPETSLSSLDASSSAGLPANE